MNTRIPDDSIDPRAGVQRDVRMVKRELKWLQIEHEHALESLQHLKRRRARLREQVVEMADALAAARSEMYWATRPSAPRRPRLLGRASTPDPEAALVRQVEASDLFDGGWYLRKHRRAVKSSLPPALHYVRHGNEAHLDPGPRFSNKAYLQQHPEAADVDIPALLHALTHGAWPAASTGPASESPATNLHL